MIYEWLHIVIHYACGHESLRPMLVQDYERDYPQHALEDSRNIEAPENCAACQAVTLRAWERKMERRGVAG